MPLACWAIKKKISDIDKAIEEMQQRRDECFKHIGKAMYESCPELGDMSVADMRKAGRYLHKFLTKKAPSQGVAPTRDGAPVASDSGGMSAPEDRKSTRLNSSHIQKSRMPSSA